tara:strand:- start:117 stop:416 length:300 start_codon:yes stop_codon:yes gene_type:complete
VVIYDCSDFGIFSATRLWWTLRVFGHTNVSVLDGGFALWKQNQLPVEAGKLKVCLWCACVCVFELVPLCLCVNDVDSERCPSASRLLLALPWLMFSAAR